MFPQNDGLITTLMMLHQAELQERIACYHATHAARAARPSALPRPADLLRRLWRRATAVATIPAQQSAQGDPQEQRAA
jgi:hypothetical protein